MRWPRITGNPPLRQRCFTQPKQALVDTECDMRRHLSLISLLALYGCFHGIDAVGHSTDTSPLLALEVVDQNASVWEARSAPRMPLLRLRADRALPNEVEQQVHLLRGTPSLETLEDLRSGALRESTAELRLPLRIRRGRTGNVLELVPLSALTADAEYTLAFVPRQGEQTFSVRISASPAAGARLVQSLPAELDTRVPPNLRRALLRYDGYVAGPVADLLALRGAEGEVPSRAQLRACSELGFAEGDCAEVTALAPLLPLSRYTLSLQAGLVDATGAALPAQEISFRTAASDDQHAPLFLATECAKDELKLGAACALLGEAEVSLRARADENGSLALTCGGKSRADLGSAGEFALTLALTEPQACVLSLTDAAGNSREGVLDLAPQADLAKLAIVEVRADPLGPEPSQEYVELLNFGDTALSIEGFTLTTDVFAAGSRIVSASALAAGERVLVVPADFDSAETSDGALPAGVRVARLERALALRNDGAALLLRDARGRRLSASPALSGGSAGQCIARTGTQLRSAAPGEFRPAACTPGGPSAAP
jgi:hypothetical protein